MHTRKCSFCGERRRFTLGLGNGCICYRCLERLNRFTKELGLFTDELRQPVLDRRHLRRPVYVVGDRIKALASLLHEAVAKRGQIYAVSFAWWRGFTRKEVRKAIEKYGGYYGWVVEKAPHNHIVVRKPSPEMAFKLIEARPGVNVHPRKKPLQVEGDRIEALAYLINKALEVRKQLYAVSFAWRYGFTRTEVKLAVEKYGGRYGWVVEKAPNNHIIIRDAASIHGPRLVEATH
jgi:hypothetical protein